MSWNFTKLFCLNVILNSNFAAHRWRYKHLKYLDRLDILAPTLRVSLSSSSLSWYFRCFQRHLWAGKFDSNIRFRRENFMKFKLIYNSIFPAYRWRCKHLKYLDRLGVLTETLNPTVCSHSCLKLQKTSLFPFASWNPTVQTNVVLHSV